MGDAIDFIETVLAEALTDDEAFEDVGQDTGGGITCTLAKRNFTITVKEDDD
ncbi:hypothetical protein [Streptomyces sp. NPDC060366]|uniref:hypothetical protein n=1 Tax=Streptomyces sp. NPDC060366 TaxID=3347105 RepID=UPI003659A846